MRNEFELRIITALKKSYFLAHTSLHFFSTSKNVTLKLTLLHLNSIKTMFLFSWIVLCIFYSFKKKFCLRTEKCIFLQNQNNVFSPIQFCIAPKKSFYIFYSLQVSRTVLLMHTVYSYIFTAKKQYCFSANRFVQFYSLKKYFF
jgi:hypothetical protein